MRFLPCLSPGMFGLAKMDLPHMHGNLGMS